MTPCPPAHHPCPLAITPGRPMFFTKWADFAAQNVQNPWSEASAHLPCVYTRRRGQAASVYHTTPPTKVISTLDLLAALQTGLPFSTPGFTP